MLSCLFAHLHSFSFTCMFSSLFESRQSSFLALKISFPHLARNLRIFELCWRNAKRLIEYQEQLNILIWFSYAIFYHNFCQETSTYKNTNRSRTNRSSVLNKSKNFHLYTLSCKDNFINVYAIFFRVLIT